MKTIFIFFVLLLSLDVYTQTYGPFNVSTATSNNSVGVNNWTVVNNILTNDATDATNSNFGLTRYAQGVQMDNPGGIPASKIITGIQVDVEKQSAAPDVALVPGAGFAWTVHPVGTSFLRAVPANSTIVGGRANRCLVVIVSLENATARNISTMTYNGVAMTQILEVDLFTTFYAKTEVWIMLDSQLPAAAGNYTLAYTKNGGVENEYFDIVSSAVYYNVDQNAPFFDTETTTRNGGAGDLQLDSPISTLPGSITLTSIFCGNPPSPVPATTGNHNGFDNLQNAVGADIGFFEHVDYHDFNVTHSATGGVEQICSKTSVVAGTEQPFFEFNGTTNRLVAVALSLRRAAVQDNSVRLRKATGYVGTNKAFTVVDWSNTDETYTTYGGPGDLWGTTWTAAEVNDALFGVGIAADINGTNGTITASIDHIQITVFTANPLPVEVSDFSLESSNENVLINWITLSERDNKNFILERSRDGNHWEEVANIEGAGNSNERIEYAKIDKNPFSGVSYYRLRQFDFNGLEKQVGFESIDFKAITYLLYPIPVNTQMILEGVNLASSKIEIVNSLGETIFVERDFIGDNLSFNFGNVKNGVYLISIETNNSKTTRRIIVAHK